MLRCRAARCRTVRPAASRTPAAGRPPHRAASAAERARPVRERQRSPAEFERGEELRGLRRSDPADLRQIGGSRSHQTVHAAARAQQFVGDAAARPAPRNPLPSTSATSSLSPSAVGPWRSSFSRGRSSGDRSFIVLQRERNAYTSTDVVASIVRRHPRASRSSRPLPAAAILPIRKSSRRRARSTRRAPPAPIGTPPRNTPAADEALKNANVAVEQRDYRLALNDALDSRERAQNAAKLAVDGKAAARSAADQAIDGGERGRRRRGRKAEGRRQRRMRPPAR